MGNGRGLIPDSADLIGAILDADPRAQLRRLHAAGQVDALTGDRADVRVGYDAAGQPLVLESVPVQAGFQPAVGDWVRLVYPNDDPSAALVEGPTVTQSTDPPGGGVPSVLDQTQVKPDAVESDAYTAPPGHLRDNLDHVRAVVKALKGTAAWITTPPATLQAARDHIDNLSNPHQTSLEQARTAGSVWQGGVSFAAGVLGSIAGAADQAVRFGFGSANGPQWSVIGPSAGANPGRLFARFGGGAAIGDLVFLWNSGGADTQVGQVSRQGGWGFGSAYNASAVDGGVNLGGLVVGTTTPILGAALINDPSGTGFAARAAGDLFVGGSSGVLHWDESLAQLVGRNLSSVQRWSLNTVGSSATQAQANLNPLVTANTHAARVGLLRSASFVTSGQVDVCIFRGDDSATIDYQFIANANARFRFPLKVGALSAPTSGYDLDVANAALVGTYLKVGTSTVIAAQAAGDLHAGGAVSLFEWDESAAKFTIRAVGTTSDVQWDRQGADQWHTPDHIQADASFYLGRTWESGNSKQGTIRLTRPVGALSNALMFIRANITGDAGERLVIGDDRIFFGGGGTVPGTSDEGFIRTNDSGTIYLDYWASGGHRFNNSDIRYMSGVDLFPNVDNDIQFGFRSAPGASAYRAAAAIITHRLELRDQRASSKQGDVLFVDTSIASQTPGTTFHDFGGGKTLKYSGLWINVNGTVYAIPAIVDTGVTAPTGPSVPA